LPTVKPDGNVSLMPYAPEGVTGNDDGGGVGGSGGVGDYDYDYDDNDDDDDDDEYLVYVNIKLT
jgi:hypothetical protein